LKTPKAETDFITLQCTREDPRGWADADKNKVFHFPNTRMGRIRKELMSAWLDIKGACEAGSFN
jgi:hypothetical protein